MAELCTVLDSITNITSNPVGTSIAGVFAIILAFVLKHFKAKWRNSKAVKNKESDKKENLDDIEDQATDDHNKLKNRLKRD